MTTLLSLTTVAERVAVHGSTLLRWARAGKFPAPIKLGDAKNATIRFSADEVDAWVQERKAERAQ